MVQGLSYECFTNFPVPYWASFYKGFFNSIVNVLILHSSSFYNGESIINMLSAGIAAEHNGLLLLSLEFTKLSLTDVVCKVYFGMPDLFFLAI